MILRGITVDHLPGLAGRFEIKDIKGGIVVIHGPNGSGKSSLCRLVSSLLWRARASENQPVRASAEWDIEGDIVTVHRTDKSVLWQGKNSGEPPFNPPADHLAGFYYLQVRDLLLDKQEADKKIQEEIIKRIYGGASPAKVSEELFPCKKSDLTAVSKDFQKAERDLQSTLQANRQLADEETRELPKLEAALNLAQQAEEEIRLLEKALNLASNRQEIAEVQRALANDFVSHVDAVDEKDLLFLRDKEKELDALENRITEAENLKKKAEKEAEASPLLQGVVDGVKLRVFGEKIRVLRRQEEDLTRAQEKKARAAEKLIIAKAELGGWRPEASPDKTVVLDEQILVQIESHLEKSQKFMELKAQCEERGRTFDNGTAPHSREQLSQALRALWGWRAASEQNRTTRRSLMTLVLLLCMISAVIGLFLFYNGQTAGLAPLAFSGLAAAIMLFSMFRPETANDGTKWERDYRAANLGSLARWTPEHVEKSIFTLEEQLRYTLKAESVCEQKTHNERELRRLSEFADQLAIQREELRTLCGIDPGASALTLMDIARRIGTFRAANQEHQIAQRQLEALVKEYDGLANDCRQFLSLHLGKPGEDYVELAALMEELEQANTRLCQARQLEKEQTDIAMTLRNQDLRRKQDDIRSFWLRFGMDTGSQQWLIKRVDFKKIWSEVKDREKHLARQIEMISQELKRLSRDDLLHGDKDELEERIEIRRTESATVKDLLRKISAMHARMETARRSHDVENALATRASALDKLASLRETRLSHIAGARLLGRVKSEHDEVSKPEILRRSDELFRLFTLHRYELDPQSKDGELGAREIETGEVKSLGALSEATRIQLLLAVRLAFVLGQESAGLKLPIFFDEILATTDPKRFEAIVHVMGTLASQDNRQIFYLTADPLAVSIISANLLGGGFHQPHVINLGLLRALSTAAETAEAFVVPRWDPLPLPDGTAKEHYGVKIRATPFDPRGRCEEQHIFHVAGDDMHLVHRLMVFNITTAGNWRSCVESKDALRILPDEAKRHRLSAAIDATEIFMSLWQPGRGRKVTMEIIDGSQLAPSAKEKIREICLDLEGHPRKILDHLVNKKNDERLKSLKKLGEFADYLKETCACHEDEMLSKEQIAGQVYGLMAFKVEKGDITTDEVLRMVHELWHKSPEY